MENNKNPLSPHLQIYQWQISSLLSISHRIVGVVNTIVITLISFWFLLLLTGETNYGIIKKLLNSFFGKFFIISISWTFSFHVLNEIRHLFWDMGYGFNLRTAKITGILVFVCSFILTILIYLIGKNFL